MRPQRCTTALSPSGLPGLRYALNPYLGCAHACAYCYAPATLRRPELSGAWGREVCPRNNIIDVLARELKRREPGLVGIGTVTDPYQPAERTYRLTRGCVSLLASSMFPFQVHTKSDLVLRDLDLLVRAGERAAVGITVTTLDEDTAARIEPGASPPAQRAAVLRRCAAEGVATWLFLGPVIPGLNDSPASLRAVVDMAAETGSHIMLDRLNLRRGVLDRLRPVMPSFRPDDLSPAWWQRVVTTVSAACKEAGLPWRSAF